MPDLPLVTGAGILELDLGVALTNGKHRPRTLDEIKAWIAEHGGEIDEKWRHQEALNIVLTAALESINAKLNSLTTRIAWATGAGFMLGGVITLVFKG